MLTFSLVHTWHYDLNNWLVRHVTSLRSNSYRSYNYETLQKRIFQNSLSDLSHNFDDRLIAQQQQVPAQNENQQKKSPIKRIEDLEKDVAGFKSELITKKVTVVNKQGKTVAMIQMEDGGGMLRLLNEKGERSLLYANNKQIGLRFETDHPNKTDHPNNNAMPRVARIELRTPCAFDPNGASSSGLAVRSPFGDTRAALQQRPANSVGQLKLYDTMNNPKLYEPRPGGN